MLLIKDLKDLRFFRRWDTIDMQDLKDLKSRFFTGAIAGDRPPRYGPRRILLSMPFGSRHSRTTVSCSFLANPVNLVNPAPAWHGEGQVFLPPYDEGGLSAAAAPVGAPPYCIETGRSLLRKHRSQRDREVSPTKRARYSPTPQGAINTETDLGNTLRYVVQGDTESTPKSEGQALALRCQIKESTPRSLAIPRSHRSSQ